MNNRLLNKKKMLLRLLIMLCCSFILFGCIGKKAPNESQIEEDLQTNVVEYKEFLKLKDYEITQSLTEDNTYTATIDIIAESQYAEFQLNADVIYTKYDQGWKMDDCVITKKDVQVKTYPTGEQVAELIREGYGDSDWQNNGFGKIIGNVVLNENEKSITYSGTYEEELTSHITTTYTIDSYWEYDSESDNWKYTDYDVNKKSKLSGIEGEWTYTDNTTYAYLFSPIIISNLTENGFDICDKGLGTNIAHVEMVTDGKNDAVIYEGECSYSYQSYSGTGTISVSFSKGKNNSTLIVTLIQVSSKLIVGNQANIPY